MRSPSTAPTEDQYSAFFRPGRTGWTSPGVLLVEGLRMAQLFTHQPVMVDEVLGLFAPVPPGVVVDATVGGGGHAAALLEAHPHLSVLGLDRDPDAVAAASARLASFGTRARVLHARFSQLSELTEPSEPPQLSQLAAEVERARAAHRPATAAASPPGLSGVLLDLGVSSVQLDRPERGFSYRRAGALDMRMDPTVGESAAGLVNTASAQELAALFAANGEGRLARRIARAIVARRPIVTTAELADVVASAVPAAARRRGHPARRVFQALRIAVNDELGEVAAVLPAALGLLAVGGRLVAISYHSGEDRLVKASFAEAATGGCTCPPGLPCVCGASPEHRLVFRGARTPSAAEVERNHRAESARMRAIERVLARASAMRA